MYHQVELLEELTLEEPELELHELDELRETSPRINLGRYLPWTTSSGPLFRYPLISIALAKLPSLAE